MVNDISARSESFQYYLFNQSDFDIYAVHFTALETEINYSSTYSTEELIFVYHFNSSIVYTLQNDRGRRERRSVGVPRQLPPVSQLDAKVGQNRGDPRTQWHHPPGIQVARCTIEREYRPGG